MKLKGIDDLLAAGGTPRRLVGDEVREFFSEYGRRLCGEDGPAAEEAGDEPATAELVPSADPDTSRPPFPLDVLPETLRSIVVRVSDALNCPPDFTATAMLTTAGAAIGAARAVRVKQNWFEWPALYTAIVSRPGTTKTPAMKFVMTPIYRAQDRAHLEFRAAQARHQEELKQFKARVTQSEGPLDEDEPEPPPSMRHHYASDTTQEALVKLLQDNPKGILVFRDELIAWVKTMDQYRKGADRQFYLSCWSGEAFKADRRSRIDDPTFIIHPFVCVLGSLQPDMMSELKDKDGRADGFFDRLLFSFPPPRSVVGWSDSEVSDQDVEDWDRIVQRLLLLQPITESGESARPQYLEFDSAARQQFADHCNSLAAEVLAPGFPETLFGFYAKLRGHCARFALILHELRIAAAVDQQSVREGPITAGDVAGAVALCDYFKGHFRAVTLAVEETAEDKLVEQVIGWMRKTERVRIRPRDLYRNRVAGLKKSTAAEQTLKLLVDRGLGTLDKSGRSSEFVLGGQASTNPPNPPIR
jgi:hypothetical protein